MWKALSVKHMAYCLLPRLAEEFKQRLRDGRINPEQLNDMTSLERREFFKEFLGEDNAKNVNALFESKLLLKNQQAGMITWAKTVTGIKPEIRRDIISRIEKMDAVLNPAQEKAFLSDLAAKKLGIDVTVEEAQKISELSKTLTEAKTQTTGRGQAQVDLEDYVRDLKKQIVKPRTVGSTLSELAGNAKSLKATGDNSAIFRQGWKVMFTNPDIWVKNSLSTFTDMVRTVGGNEVMNEVRATMYEKENYINGRYKKADLALIKPEEDFPTSWAEKIPGVGRIYKASEVAFTAFQYRNRMDVFDLYTRQAEKLGRDIEESDFLKNTGHMVNDLTARANLGKYEGVASTVNNVFFSPRKLVADLHFLTAELGRKGVRQDPFLRQKAAMNLVKVIAGTASILAIANALKPGSVEPDSTSSDWGKIKIGNTRFDVTAGMGSIIVLASRAITRSSKSTQTGKKTKLNSGKYGSMTVSDLFLGDQGFLANKLSPAAKVVWETWFVGHDFQGNKPTILGELKNAYEPLPFTNAEELLKDPNSANDILSIIADALGIGTNTYSKKK